MFRDVDVLSEYNYTCILKHTFTNIYIYIERERERERERYVN